jgi:uncharacterized protein YcbX
LSGASGVMVLRDELAIGDGAEAVALEVDLTAFSTLVIETKMEDQAHNEKVTDEAMPPSTFFDCGVVHLLTAATLKRLGQFYPEGSFDLRRFRPNIFLDSPEEGFVENSWVGRTVAIGQAVRLLIVQKTGRCVMTTLPQGNLPKDLGILRLGLCLGELAYSW